MENQITYETIINFLKPNQLVFGLGSSNKITFFKDNLNYYGLPSFSNEIDYYLASLIFTLNKEEFVSNEEQFEEKMLDLKTFLKENKINEDYLSINQYFNINTIILGENNYFIPSNEMVDLYLPTIILYYQHHKFYPCTLNQQRIIFYNEEDENNFISKFFESQPKVFNNLIQDYQLRDSIEESIESLLNKNQEITDIVVNNNTNTENNCFINQEDIKTLYQKMKKAELIEIILSKKDLSKSTLNKLKKEELLDLLNN